MDDEALLSQPIKELIMRLASGLREEAQAIIDQNKQEFTLQTQTLSTQNKELKIALEAIALERNEFKDQLECSLTELSAYNTAQGVFEEKAAEARQTESKLTALLDEKQAQIDSLEEKHQHSREALEHYRQSVKEQRDQDQRKHEQQIQQLQTENRTLNQTLSVKQTEITQLNKDNSRLVSELGATQKAVASLESAKHKLENQSKTLDSQVQSMNIELTDYRSQEESWTSDKTKLAQIQGEFTTWKQDSIVKIARFEAEVDVKNELIERLLVKKQKDVGAPVGKEYGSPDCEYD